MASLLTQLNAELAALVHRARQSLVQVADGTRGAGAGVVLHEDGLILTAAHVLRHRAPRVRLADGRELTSQVLGYDASRDLAVLAVEEDRLEPMPFGDSSRLRAGEWVMALGHPWGVAGGTTAGVVVGAGKDLPEAPRPWRGAEWIAVNLHLRPGHSGGPLVDYSGRLIGVNTMMTGPDVGLAVPAHVAKSFLREHLGGRAAKPNRRVFA